MQTRLWSENLKGRDLSEDITRRWKDYIGTDLKKTGWESVGCTHLAQGRDQERTTVNTAMNFRVPYKAGNFLTELLSISQEKLLSVELFV
jgi:hypothetical protein